MNAHISQSDWVQERECFKCQKPVRTRLYAGGAQCDVTLDGGCCRNPEKCAVRHAAQMTRLQGWELDDKGANNG